MGRVVEAKQLNFFFSLKRLYVYECFVFIYVSTLYTVYGDQNRMLLFLELELGLVVSCLVGPGN